MRQTVIIAVNTAKEIDRMNSLKQLLMRLQEAAPGGPATGREDRRIAEAIERLRRKKTLFVRETPDKTFEVVYNPSLETKQAVYNFQAQKSWDEKTIKKGQAAFRQIPGALFRFPVVDSDDHLEAFITDWSPFPGAAALAVHRNHALSKGAFYPENDYFTGNFVYHPLTGDILPVWVADWVDPGFGTGVVIINPAHSQVDLEFARRIGLPVRFALVPESWEPGADPWLVPPIIKTGVTTKTGILDGLTAEESVEAYFNRLQAGKFAEKHIDLSIRGFSLFEFSFDEHGEFDLCQNCGRITVRTSSENNACGSCGQFLRSCSLNLSNVFSAILSIEEEDSFDIFYPVSEIGGAFVLARLLYFELSEKNLLPDRIFSVAGTVATNASFEGQLLELGLNVASPLNQPAVLKQQILDQIHSFANRHNEICQKFTNGAQTPDLETDGFARNWKQIGESISNGQLNEAFSSILNIQKRIIEDGFAKAHTSLPAYFAAAYVLTGFEYPQTLSLQKIWDGITNAPNEVVK